MRAADEPKAPEQETTMQYLATTTALSSSASGPDVVLPALVAVLVGIAALAAWQLGTTVRGLRTARPPRTSRAALSPRTRTLA